MRFSSNRAGDGAVLADLLRAYGILLAEEDRLDGFGFAGGGEDSGSGLPDTETAMLRITWAPSFSSLTITWAQKGGACSHAEAVAPAGFQETEENRRRRTLRLAFHHLLEKEPGLQGICQAPPSPWGILTGVRPSKMLQRFIDQGLSDEEIASILDGDFGIERSRASLLLQVGRLQRPFLPRLDEGRDRVSLYLCYPFCPSRCGYCSFPGYEAGRWRKWREPCLQAMETEIRQVGKAATDKGFLVETLYFGGGTPTCMSPSQMDRLLWALQESFAFLPGLEWTVEGGRPETLTDEMLGVLASHPVNRICINPQSLNQGTLDRIGRLHRAEDTGAAFARVRETMERENRGDWRVNCDLILGLPGEGVAEVEKSLSGILAMQPDNVTVHGLAIKRGSAYKDNRETLPGRLLGLAMIALSRDMLAGAGYLPYYLYRQKDSLAGSENIGYAQPGKECLYNILMIEERQTILGLGAGAGSKFLRRGEWALENMYNPKDMIQYIHRVEELISRKVDKLAMVG